MCYIDGDHSREFISQSLANCKEFTKEITEVEVKAGVWDKSDNKPIYTKEVLFEFNGSIAVYKNGKIVNSDTIIRALEYYDRQEAILCDKGYRKDQCDRFLTNVTGCNLCNIPDAEK